MLLKLWTSLSRWPLGKSLFSWVLGRYVPYTGSISPRVLQLSSGSASVQMHDHRKVRNHLNSIHAIALLNLGEVTTGLAVMSLVPSNARAIITRLEIDYFKKARGTMVAEATVSSFPPEIKEPLKQEVEAKILNRDQEIVAKVRAHWLVSSKA